MPAHPFEPKLVTVFREGYSRAMFGKDLLAGTMVGIMALPLAIAFAIAAGVKPEQGLITAIVAGGIISLLSGNRFQIGGPTGAFVVIILGIVNQHGVEGLAIATMMAGVLQILFGLARFGVVIQYIPYPVTVGFTSGIAVIIFTGQVRDLLGLKIEKLPGHFVEQLQLYAENLSKYNLTACLLAVVTIVIVRVANRLDKRIPGALIAILLTSLATWAFTLPVETIESRFGTVPSTFPTPALPWRGWEACRELISPAISIALLGGIESLLSAMVADGMTGRRHRSNMELIAQGAANLASPLFGGIPATGAIARTAANIRLGGVSPVSGLVHAAVLLLIMLFFAPWASRIPMASLAGLLALIAWNMSEAHLFLRLFKSPKSDIVVLLLTFGLTIFADLVIAIQVGVVLAAFLFMRRMAEVSDVASLKELGEDAEEETGDPYSLAKLKVPPDVAIFEINGPFFFGAAEKFKNALRIGGKRPRVLILRMRRVPCIDATGLQAFEDVVKESIAARSAIILSGLNPQPAQVLEKSGLLARIGAQNACPTIDAALHRAELLLAELPNSTSTRRKV